MCGDNCIQNTSFKWPKENRGGFLSSPKPIPKRKGMDASCNCLKLAKSSHRFRKPIPFIPSPKRQKCEQTRVLPWPSTLKTSGPNEMSLVSWKDTSLRILKLLLGKQCCG